jgi:ppGpp synthetase/RelA/SpoT-type nucleotidyltranferase
MANGDLEQFGYGGEYARALHGLRGRYSERRETLSMLKDQVLRVILARLDDEGLTGEVQVSGRVKDLDSFRRKFKSKYDRLTKELLRLEQAAPKSPTMEKQIEDRRSARIALLRDPFLAAGDLVGIRCLCTFSNLTAESSLLSKIVLSAFAEGKATDRTRLPLRDDKKSDDGYNSVHHDLFLKQSDYKGLLEIPFELQIRTLCHHVWSEVSHRLHYKSGDKSSSDRLAALSAKLNAVQAEIDVIRQESVSDYEELIRTVVDKGDITSFAQEPLSERILKVLALYEFKTFNPPLEQRTAVFSPLWLNHMVESLQSAGYQKVEDVLEVLSAGRKHMETYRRELHEDGLVFKKDDGTDLLSKALIFGDAEIRSASIARNYPLLDQTRRYVEKITKPS